MSIKNTGRAAAVLLTGAAFIAAIGLAPAHAADHLDAPGTTSPGGDKRSDINDLYVFEGSKPRNTVAAATVNPLAAGGDAFLQALDGAYFLRVDRDGDAKEDVTYSVTFADKWRDDDQFVLVRRATGKDARSGRPSGRMIGVGTTDRPIHLRGGGTLFAGPRSDPFFFDLGGFQGSVEGTNNGRMLNDVMVSDFFDELNTLAIVLEVPDKELGKQVGVWATTNRPDRSWSGPWSQVDRMGRPAINTVVNSSGPIVQADSNAKNVFNAAKPRNDVRDFTGATVNALQALSALDSEGSYSDAEARALAAVLLPDVITYDTRTEVVGPLNGRALDDDVIDVELRIVTGGDPLGLFPGRDADGGINTDGVGPHDDYLSTFPYLGNPH